MLAVALASLLFISLAPGSVAAQGAAPKVIRPSSTLGPAMADQPAGSSASKPAATGTGSATASNPPPKFPGMARFRSIGKPDAVMFDAPSEKAKKIYQAPQGMPVEVVSVLRIWIKVRDPLGDLAWVVRDDLSDRRTLVAMVTAPLLREPQAGAPSWFDVARGVQVELLDERPVNGFVKVRYVDGQIGYLLPSQVWGL